MKNKNVSIRKVVGYLNNEEHDGGFWLPNIQRPFVWDTEQIEKLFDSIMREYPISTLLVWRTPSGIKRRKFIDNYFDNLKLSQFQVPEDRRTKLLVLDGQQRLQSLFIGLKGSYNKKELYFNVYSGELVTPEEMRFKFRFMSPDKAMFPWVNFKKVVFSNALPNDLADRLASTSSIPLNDDQKRTLLTNLWKAQQVFVSQEVVSYQELDSVDNPDLYSEDDVVEIFIRANSGGTKLGKSDLLFSLLTASWEDADEAMEDLIAELNTTGYSFSRDFILKACLVLLGKGASYDVKKFRDDTTKQAIIERWAAISTAIKDVRDFIHGKTYIRSDAALPSYLGLIPVIYFRYHFPEKWSGIKSLDTYLLRTLLCGAFSGRPDGLIDKCVRRIREDEEFVVKDIFDVIYSDGRNLDVSEDTLLNASYGSKNIHLIFNLWYRQFDYKPAYEGNQPQVDHIFPQSILRDIKEMNPATGRYSIMRYPAHARDQIANCMLLTADENGFQGKNNTEPKDWFEGKSDQYLNMHLIPRNPSLWLIDNYEKFIEARQRLIVDKFQALLTQSTGEDSRVKPDQATAVQPLSSKDLSDDNKLEEVSPVATKMVDEPQPTEVPTTQTAVGFDEGQTSQHQKEVALPSHKHIAEAEGALNRFLIPITSPTKYIAGFRTTDGKEVALERESSTITLWTQPVESEDTDFQAHKVYAPESPRNSNVNRKNCPALSLGNPALVWKLYDLDELLDFINWYSGAVLVQQEGVIS